MWFFSSLATDRSSVTRISDVRRPVVTQSVAIFFGFLAHCRRRPTLLANTTTTTMALEEWTDVTAAQDGGIKKKILRAAPEGARGPPPVGYEVTGE